MRRDALRSLNRAMFRLDGKIENALTGQGIAGIDPAESTVRRTTHLSPAAARYEYRGSWAARREIDRPTADLVSQGYEISDLPEWVDAAAVLSYTSDLGCAAVPEDRGVLPALARLFAEGLKTGGAALVLVLDDGLPTHAPVDLARIRSIRFLELLERDEIRPYYASARARVPEHYIIGTARTELTPASIVHRSRVILAKGDRLSPSEEWAGNGWGISALELLADERRAMHTAAAELGSAITRTTVDALYIAELEEMLADDSAKVTVEERLALVARSRGQHKIIPLDAGQNPGEAHEPGRPADKYESIARPVDGLDDLLSSLEKHWAAGTGQTPSIALGLNVGGLNTGANAGDWQSWGGRVDGMKELWLRPRLEYVLELAFAAADGPTGGRVPETWALTFPSLVKPSALEAEQIRTQRAAGDGAYAAMAAITGPEIGEQRFRHGNTGELVLARPDSADLDNDGDLTEPEPDEVAVIFSTDPIPGDLLTAPDLARWLTERFGLKVSTVKIGMMRKAGQLRSWPVAGKIGHSKREAMRAVAIENGLLDPDPSPVADAVGVRIWRTQGDADVRPEHRALEGVEFGVDERHATEGEPGEMYGCRCYWEQVPTAHAGREPTKKQTAAAERAKTRAAKLARERG